MRITALALTLLVSSTAAFAQSKTVFAIVAPAGASDSKVAGEKLSRYLSAAPSYSDELLQLSGIGRCTNGTTSARSRCVRDALAWSAGRIGAQLAAKNIDTLVVVQPSVDKYTVTGVSHFISRDGSVKSVDFTLEPVNANDVITRQPLFTPDARYLVTGDIGRAAVQAGVMKDSTTVKLKNEDGNEITGLAIVK